MSDTSNPDVPPPRYREGDGHHRLILDEQEWLARPHVWGIEILADPGRWRKRGQYELHLRDRLINFVTCPICRGRIPDLFSEESGFIQRDDWDVHDWYKTSHGHDQPRCDAWSVIKRGVQFQRGIICPADARNGVISELIQLAQTLPMTPERIKAWNDVGNWQPVIALELVGPNPFRPVLFDPAWRTDTAVSLARHVYESRDFSAMPILADALQDAGCDSADVLNHCRDPKQVHVRGCWVVDLVLGKA